MGVGLEPNKFLALGNNLCEECFRALCFDLPEGHKKSLALGAAPGRRQMESYGEKQAHLPDKG